MYQGSRDLDQGGLTSAIRSKDDPALPRMYLPIERVENLPLAPAQGYFGEIQDGHSQRTYRNRSFESRVRTCPTPVASKDSLRP